MRLMGDKEAIADCMTEINTLKILRQVPSVVSLRYASLFSALLAVYCNTGLQMRKNWKVKCKKLIAAAPYGS